MSAIIVKNLSKKYGRFQAVDDISFEIKSGEIFGFLGPNGAGKTTTLEIVEGLRSADHGEVTIAGLQLNQDYAKIKEIIGVQLQTESIFEKIKVGEALKIFAGYYKKSLDPGKVLDMISLRDKRESYFEHLSGGQKQRLAIGLALINDPEIVFMDEPSAGIDPQARHNLWDMIQEMKNQNRTILLTTHYMEEAQKLCDRVAIMDKGKIIDLDAPAVLIRKRNLKSAIQFSLNGTLSVSKLQQIEGVSDVKQFNGKATLFTSNPIKTLSALMELSRKNQYPLEQMVVKEANLEDLFLDLTGRDLRE